MLGIGLLGTLVMGRWTFGKDLIYSASRFGGISIR